MMGRIRIKIALGDRLTMIDPMSVVNGAKEIAELVKKYNDIPLYQKIVELQGQVVELASERLDLFTVNQELNSKLELKAKTSFRNPYYYEEGNEVPLCPKCYASSNGQVRMFLTHPPAQYPRGIGRACHNCRQFYYESGSAIQRRTIRGNSWS
jgi:hypothetical protein